MGLNSTDRSVKRQGHLHPVTHIIHEIHDIFFKLGFLLAEGPEIETEFYNFDALNIPEYHPSRDMWDTFWLEPVNAKKLLRTHTSPVQIRHMEKNRPPLRIIAPGKVYRHEATDATHEAQFFQLEGLVVDKGVSLGNLKWTIEHFLREFFKAEVDIRFRPTYFPFVEPGVEIDMTCFKCAGLGCSICKKTGWIELMGAGMVHPTVFQNVGINPLIWTGFAFGVGIDRLALLKYGIDDVRLLYAGDVRLIEQF